MKPTTLIIILLTIALLTLGLQHGLSKLTEATVQKPSKIEVGL